MDVNSEVKFANGITATVVEVWANGTYVVEPKYPQMIIPFGCTRLTINNETGQPYGVSNLSYTVVDVIPARKTKTARKLKKDSNSHAYGSFCPLKIKG